MRFLAWVQQIWRWLEPVERLDWLLETVGLRERIRQLVVAILGGVVMLIVQRLRDAPIDWIVLMVVGSAGLIFYSLKQLSEWSAYQKNKKALYQLNPNARPTVAFFTPRRLFAYIATLAVAMFALNLHRGSSGIEWPWSGGEPPHSVPSASGMPEATRIVRNNFYVSFSFPHLAGTEVEVELRLLSQQDNPVSVEDIGVIELFGNNKEPYLQLDECYDLNIVEIMKNEMNSSPTAGSRTKGSSVAKPLQFVIYANPLHIILNGRESNFPLEIPPNRPIIVNATFPVDQQEKNRPNVNFLVVCPSVKLFDTRGQESVSPVPRTNRNDLFKG
jgi:hypothetical protein